jgi:flagellar biosynthesis/type III secretory pathway chaperone
MDEQTRDDLFSSLEALLIEERRALLAGSFENLAAIGEEKARLLDALDALDPDDAEPLQALQNAISRNQVLLQSALSGIRDVAERMALLRRVRESLQTYDAQGHKSEVYRAGAGKLEKRA